MEERGCEEVKYARLLPALYAVYDESVFRTKDTGRLRVLAIGKDSWVAVEADWFGSTGPYKRKSNGMKGEELHAFIDPIMTESEDVGFYWVKKSMLAMLPDEVEDNQSAMSYLEGADPW